MEHSKTKQFIFIPREILKEIKSAEKQALLINAICLMFIAFNCIAGIDIIKNIQMANPSRNIQEIYRASILACAIETFIFVVWMTHFLIWTPSINRYVKRLEEQNIEPGMPIRQHSIDLLYDGHPIRTYLSAMLVYGLLEEGCYYLLPNGWFLDYLSIIHIVIAFCIFVGGLSYIHQMQQKHLLELESNLEQEWNLTEQSSTLTS